MSELHKIEIRQRENSEGAMTGANTEVFLDGERLKGVTGVKFEVKTKGVAKLQLEMLGNYAVAGVIGELEQVYIPFVPKDDFDKDVVDFDKEVEELSKEEKK